MSRQAVYLAHGREAVQLARVAQQGIGGGAPPVVGGGGGGAGGRAGGAPPHGWGVRRAGAA
jgi:hypothetical protein